MKPSDGKENLKPVKASFDLDTQGGVDRNLRSMLADFRQDLSAHPSLQNDQPSGWLGRQQKIPFWRIWFRRLLVLASGTVCLTVLMAILFIGRTPTWADVEKQFGTIQFCSISAYFRNNPFENPLFAQYWFGADGRARIHIDHYVIFLERGTRRQSYNVKTRSKGHPYSAIKRLFWDLERAKESGPPDLRTIIEVLAGEEIVDTTDLVISDTRVADDLLVFDARSRDTLWWLRVWSLRESKLPARILKWHRKDGRYYELLFTYSKEQPSIFFDPEAFAAMLHDQSIDQHSLMNMYLQDPGGRAFPTPGS